MKLYTFPPSPNSIKVMALVHQLGLEPEVQVLDLTQHEASTPEFKAVNPNGMIPTLVDGEVTLWESNAILLYLAEKHGSPLYPTDFEQRTEMNRWLFWQVAHFGPAIGGVVWERVAPMFFKDHQTDHRALNQSLEKLARFAPILDDHLADRRFVLGAEPCLADLALGAPLCHKEMGQLPVDSYQHMMQWFGRLMELPYFKKALPQMPAPA